MSSQSPCCFFNWNTSCDITHNGHHHKSMQVIMYLDNHLPSVLLINRNFFKIANFITKVIYFKQLTISTLFEPTLSSPFLMIFYANYVFLK